ncbi:TPA: fimbrial protein [Serratia fonticola]
MSLHCYSIPSLALSRCRGLPAILVGFIVILASIFQVHAADLGVVNLRMTATLVANTCTISHSSLSKTVDMGTWATKQLVTPQGLPPVRFTINLENCGGLSSGVAVSFSGKADSDNNTLLALTTGKGAASKVAIAILDKDRNRIPLGRASAITPLAGGAANASLVFYSQYVATARPVTAGAANADATFTLDYQ